MSSALASLGRLRKVSLPLPELQEGGKRAVCFEKDSYTEDEAALLSEILPPSSWPRTTASFSSSLSLRSKAKDSSPGDTELMSTMVKRLTELEQRVRGQTQEINRKNQKIAVLEEKLSVLQLSKETAGEPKRQQELEKYLQLQNQVWEMEKFLNDYGMVWVGAEKDESSNVYLKEEEEPRELPVPSGPVWFPGYGNHVPATKDSSDRQPRQSDVTESSKSTSHSVALEPGGEVLPYKSQSDPEKDLIVLQDAHSSILASCYSSLEEPVIKGIQKLEHNMNNVIQEVSSTLTALNYSLGQILQSPAITSRVDKNKSGHDAAVKSFRMDFDLVLENIKDLNILAGEGEARIEHIAGGARLKRPDPIALALFKNGIVMFNGPFRSFNQPSTQHCMQDIMDGYFPSELQSRYPNGIPIKVTDRRDVMFRDRRLREEFPGVGQTIEGSLIPNVAAQQDSEVVKETSEIPGPKLSTEQFLNRLPKTVIRAGKVIDIRGEIKGILQVPSNPASDNVILIETPSLTTLRERLKDSEENQPPLFRNMSTLRIKSENGEKTYIVKMRFSETIGDLRTYLNQSRRGQLDYDIISTFPQQVYSDQSKTLMEYELVPNALLILRARRLPAPQPPAGGSQSV